MKYLLVGLLFLAGCASTQQGPVNADIVPPVKDSEYAALINKLSQRQQAYDGFYNMYQAYVLLITSEMENEILQRKGNFLQWSQAQWRAEKEKAAQVMSSETTVMLSFYSPDFQYDDFAKGNSIWRVYLEVNGQRYEGKASKNTDKLVTQQNVYPFHERFNTLYALRFGVPTTVTETAEPVLVITSSLGTSTFKFKP